MAENSNIEWTDHTFNPWRGCTKVSAGCKHCYAETMMKRWGSVKWGPTGQRVRTSPAYWRQPLKWNREAQAAGVRRRVFCASLADVFEVREGHPQCDELQAWREDLFNLILETPHLDWLLLTKRPQNVMPAVEWWARMGGREMVLEFLSKVWIGTSVESQATAAERLGHLVSIPAAVRFISMEPLLEPVSIKRWLGFNAKMSPETGIDWVIVGGESGRGARPMHPDWVRQIRDDCTAAGVPFFFKQWGEYAPAENVYFNHPRLVKVDIGKWENAVEEKNWAWMERVGKKAAGRLLDGRQWDEYPEVQP